MTDDAGEFYYDPDDWERLSDALKRLGEDDFYRAWREHKLAWLFLAADFDPFQPAGAVDRRTARPIEVEAPPGLGPSDFHGSQPVKLWKRKRGAWPDHDFAFWVVVSKADVATLCRPLPRDMSALAAPLPRAVPRRKKGSPEVERAKGALIALYPKGVPDQATVRDNVLHKQVNDDWLNKKGLSLVSLDSVLRAAGRRIDRK